MLKSVFFLLQMFSKTSADEVFMHHFENMLSASGGFAPKLLPGAAPVPCWGTSVLQTPSLPTPEKILQAPAMAKIMQVDHLYGKHGNVRQLDRC